MKGFPQQYPGRKHRSLERCPDKVNTLRKRLVDLLKNAIPPGSKGEASGKETED